MYTDTSLKETNKHFKTFVESHKKINMTYLFTVFAPRQHVFKNNDSKMIDLGQKGNNVFIVVLVYLTVFFSL